jgi:phospho-N-acetylmuramoyl-pentapeptide-transferase
MLFLLIKHNLTWLEAHSAGFLRVFTFVTFQALVAVMLSFGIVYLLAPRTIRWLRRLKIGDRPDVAQEDINKLMASKEGTPTMGGILIVPAIIVATLLLADMANFYVQMALICVAWLGGVGAVDDWLKLTRDRRGEAGRQGLTTLEKLLAQIWLATMLAYFTYHYGQNIAERNRLYFPFFKDVSLALSPWAFILLSTVIMVGYSNAANLTDGMDGLASGCMAITGFAFIVLAVIVGVSDIAGFLNLPYIQASDQMAVLAGAMTGACLGFLWFNCYPAQVIMGDTGSLAMGGLIGYIAIVIRQELMLLLVGGIFAAEAASVILQVGYFKYTRHRYGEGRRVFLMAPLHYHFQKLGWPEQKIVVRFWLITAMLAALALATVKLR